MSQRERDRLKVLHEIQKGQLRQQQAAGARLEEIEVITEVDASRVQADEARKT